MEFLTGSTGLIVALIILWYLKNALSDTLEATGRMASREMAQAEGDQIIRHHQQDAKRTAKFEAIQAETKTVLTAQDIINMAKEGKI